MTFYTLQYLQNQREVNQLVIYSLSGREPLLQLSIGAGCAMCRIVRRL